VNVSAIAQIMSPAEYAQRHDVPQPSISMPPTSVQMPTFDHEKLLRMSGVVWIKREAGLFGGGT
jgi:hypothetical protein